jgi:hypothetical protein
MTEQITEPALPSPAGWRVKRYHAALVILAVVSVFAIRAKWFSGASLAAPVMIVESSSPPKPAEKTETASSAEKPSDPSLIGSWRDRYYGERTMTFRADGTGTMLIMLDSVGQAFYGEKLLFEIAWENDDGVLVMTFLGGEPKSSVATISKVWGTRHEQKIESLTESELQLRSTDSKNLYTLKRLEDGE